MNSKMDSFEIRVDRPTNFGREFPMALIIRNRSDGSVLVGKVVFEHIPEGEEIPEECIIRLSRDQLQGVAAKLIEDVASVGIFEERSVAWKARYEELKAHLTDLRKLLGLEGGLVFHVRKEQ